MSESLAEKIAQTLQKCCPAFKRVKDGAAVWHGCRCQAKRADGNPCLCVWHTQSTCMAGKWPQLAFVDETKAKEQQKADRYLEKAKQALAD